MSEIMCLGSSEMSIRLNDDGTYTARALGMETICATFAEAVVSTRVVKSKNNLLSERRTAYDLRKIVRSTRNTF